MVSPVAICNIAMIKLKAETITSLSDDKTEAVYCNILYEPLRDSVLASHPWNFALDQEVLQLSPDAPLFGYSYKFSLPSKCLRVIEAVDTSGLKIKYKVKGRYLHTNVNGVQIEFIKKITDTNLFSPMFIDTLATRIAMELAYPIAGSETRGNTLAEEFKDKLREAKTRDGQEGTPDKITAKKWIQDRN